VCFASFGSELLSDFEAVELYFFNTPCICQKKVVPLRAFCSIGDAVLEKHNMFNP